MAEQHPTQPPPELLIRRRGFATTWEDDMRAAYAAGADAELEACVEWGNEYRNGLGRQLRADRRPKPPSLKEKAFDALDRLTRWNGDTEARLILLDILEALPDD